MRLLIVKTSSMGDVVHATPVVADICRQHPGAVIDWLVEAPFAAIPQLHPGVRRVWPMAWRKWRGQLLQATTWRTMRTLRDDLRDQRYELVLDLQGLLKSALWARQAAAPVALYAGGISAYAPHPFAARLWWEFVMGDEGQNLYLKGYAHPSRFNDMVKRGVVPQAMLDKLPPAELYQKATFLTVEQLNASKAYITDNWRKVVYGEG